MIIDTNNVIITLVQNILKMKQYGQPKWIDR